MKWWHWLLGSIIAVVLTALAVVLGKRNASVRSAAKIATDFAAKAQEALFKEREAKATAKMVAAQSDAEVERHLLEARKWKARATLLQTERRKTSAAVETDDAALADRDTRDFGRDD